MDPTSWATIWDPYPCDQARYGFGRALHWLSEELKAGESKPADNRLNVAFARLCSRVVRYPATLGLPAWPIIDPNHVGFSRALSHACGLLHRTQAVLSMLMHYELTDAGRIHNRRRPRVYASTYPNSPVVAHLLGKHVAKQVSRSVRARARGALLPADTRIVDPTAESGQLLLAVALEMIRQAQELGRLDELEGMCAQHFVAADRNPRAQYAIRAIFDALGRCFPVLNLGQPRVLIGDSVALADAGKFGKITALVNNPPWGDFNSTNTKCPERAWTFHRRDPYVEITGLAINAMPEGAPFGLVLPSQFLGSRSSAKLRSYLTETCSLSDIRVLPRAPFRHATVRSVTLLGSTLLPGARRGRVRLEVLSRVPVGVRGTTSRRTVCAGRLLEAGSGSWQSVIMGPAELDTIADCVALGSVAEILTGVKPYKRGGGEPSQTAHIVRHKPFTSDQPRRGFAPAVRGRHVGPFCVRSQGCYVKLGAHLAESGRHPKLLQETRVFLREIADRDGTLFAAEAPHNCVPLHGVLTVLPRRVHLAPLIAILNSRLTAEWLRHHASSMLKVDYQRVTVAELARLPIPRVALSPEGHSALGRLSSIDRAATFGEMCRLGAEIAVARESADRQREMQVRKTLNGLVELLYRENQRCATTTGRQCGRS